MNIIVCIKQVPGTTKVDIDPDTGVLKRDGTESKMNPYDLYALESAIKLKEKYGGSVSVITMGPPQAKEIIFEAYSIGADYGYILSDKAFAGSDVLATSYTLSQGISHIENYDVIICGKQTTDGDTAQVGPEIAEFLNIPHASGVIKLHDISDNSLEVTLDMGEYTQRCKIKLPCLIAVEKDIFVPRLPSYKKKMTSCDREVVVKTLSDLDNTNPDMYGLTGSPTQVERIFSPEIKNEKVIVKGNAETLATSVFDKLKELKFI